MTVELVFDSEDMARLQRTLAKLDKEHLFGPMAESIGGDIQAKASVYPAATWRNRPGHSRGYWYERGYGYRGKADVGMTSERLDASWYHAVYPDYVKIGNDASYAWRVHGEHQEPLFKQIGWRKLLDVAKERLPGIIRKLEAQALKIWESGK